ncbi:MAG: hypothetical protein ACXVGA_04390 [Mycobacteriaceae bacterium]
MDRWTDVYAGDLTFTTMKQGEITEAAGGDYDATPDPELVTLVITNGDTVDSLGVLGGRSAIRELAARLQALVQDDAVWT